MANNKFFGFFSVNTNGRLSVQVVDGSAREGFATEKTARAKVNARVDANNSRRPGSAWAPIVCSFPDNNAMYKYLDEANRLIRGEP